MYLKEVSFMPYYRKRGDIWYYTISVILPNGTRKNIEKAGGYSRMDAKSACRKAIAEMEYRGKYEDPKIIFNDLLTEWMENHVEVNLSENTYASYKSKIDNHISPALGEYKIKEINGKVLQDFLNDKKTHYSKSSMQIFVAILKGVFSYAVQPCEYLSISPADHISIQKYKNINSNENEAYIFSPEDMKKIFAEFTENHQFHVPIQLSYHTGMRLGECLALEWDNIDMENKTITIKHTLLDRSEVKKGTTKTKASKRVITFSEKLYQILKKHKARQAADKLEYGKFYLGLDQNYVCTENNGSVLTANSMRWFGKWCKNVLGKGSFHSLRHTHASMLLENNFSMMYVSKRLGHSKVSTTANIYAHVTAKMEDYAREKMEHIF